MEDRSSKRWGKATLALIGTIIGAGVFALPAMFSRVGFWPATVLFWFLTAVILLTHLYYAEIILKFKDKQRLAGYAGKVLGSWGYVVGAITYPLQAIGVNLIYIILGGTFLGMVMSLVGIQVPLLIWQLAFWAFGAIIVLLGLRVMAKVEAWLTGLLIISVIGIVGCTAPQWNTNLTIGGDWSGLLIPFGVFLFSISGVSVISEMADIVGRNKTWLRRAVWIGTLGAALLSWLFGAGLFLASKGQIGTQPADLIKMLPVFWRWMIPVMGLLAVVTSYVTSAEDLKKTLQLDFHLKKRMAWVIGLFSPLLLFAVERNWLQAIDLVGTVFGAVNAFLIVFIAAKLFHGAKKTPFLWSLFGAVIILLTFVIGILHRFLYSTAL